MDMLPPGLQQTKSKLKASTDATSAAITWLSLRRDSAACFPARGVVQDVCVDAARWQLHIPYDGAADEAVAHRQLHSRRRISAVLHPFWRRAHCPGVIKHSDANRSTGVSKRLKVCAIAQRS